MSVASVMFASFAAFCSAVAASAASRSASWSTPSSLSWSCSAMEAWCARSDACCTANWACLASTSALSSSARWSLVRATVLFTVWSNTSHRLVRRVATCSLGSSPASSCPHVLKTQSTMAVFSTSLWLMRRPTVITRCCGEVTQISAAVRTSSCCMSRSGATFLSSRPYRSSRVTRWVQLLEHRMRTHVPATRTAVSARTAGSSVSSTHASSSDMCTLPLIRPMSSCASDTSVPASSRASAISVA
mmetsp:Transcript_27879/g.53044  ORF Transcript_27879/g.53044 Transcript_27879/m.53044 type:complete len:245 (-) Transcript_27879:1596-2330(-)